jgi:hypothetical protein
VPKHSPRVFVEKADVVTGVGWDRAAAGGPAATVHFALRRVVTNLAVLDWDTPDHRIWLASVHPAVSVADVAAATGFELIVPPRVPKSRISTIEELRLIRPVIDPRQPSPGRGPKLNQGSGTRHPAPGCD